MDMHIRLQVLDDFRWPRLVMLLRLAGYAASAAFMLYVAYGGWDLTMRSMHTPSTALRMPMGVVYATLPIAFGLMTILLVVIMVRLVRGRDVVLDRPE
jgi:TRAP-type C4-dicarboxylate transport system permease small subunit